MVKCVGRSARVCQTSELHVDRFLKKIGMPESGVRDAIRTRACVLKVGHITQQVTTIRMLIRSAGLDEEQDLPAADGICDLRSMDRCPVSSQQICHVLVRGRDLAAGISDPEHRHPW